MLNDATPTAPPPALEEPRLLGFYDRVRSRTLTDLDPNAGRLAARIGAALLLVPDVLLLLIRLFLDRRTPQSSRALIGGALAYFLLPADLAPEIVLGPVGYLEDLIIAATVLSHVLGPELASAARRYWSGPGKALDVLTDLSASAGALLGAGMAARVERVLERRLTGRGSRDGARPDARRRAEPSG